MPSRSLSPLLAICLLAAAPGDGAQGVEFRWSWDVPAEQQGAIQAAAQQGAAWWAEVLADPITVQVKVTTADSRQLGPWTLASTEFGFATFDYPVVRQALADDATSAADRMAVSHLGSQGTLAMRTRTADGQTIVDDSQANWNRFITVTSASARALGLDPELPEGEPDGRIVLNGDWLVEGAGPPHPEIDLALLFAHELGHVLGFQSGVDQIDWASLPNGPLAPMDLHGFSVIHTLDLLRYSAESLPWIDMAPGGSPYFSLDGGAQPLGYFSTGEYNGDGWEASHWRQGEGLMEPAQSDGSVPRITRLDRWAMDAIGWDLATFACGDFEGDEDVDAADLAVLIGNWTGSGGLGGRAVSFFQGDCDGDDDVDSADLAGLIGNWTGVRAWQPARPLRAVPEPPGCALGALGLLGLGAAAARRRRP